MARSTILHSVAGAFWSEGHITQAPAQSLVALSPTQ